MEILDLLTLVFCALAVALNAAACLVLLKRKSGKATPAYSPIFATLAFVFIILGCLGYLFSDYAIAMPATLALSGLCMLIYFGIEKAPQPYGDYSFAGGGGKRYGVADFDFSKVPYSEDDSQLDSDYGVADFGFSGINSLVDELQLDGVDGLDFESPSEDFSAEYLGFSADDLDDLDMDDFDMDFSLGTELNDDDFDAVFPPDDDDALFVDALLDDDDMAARPEREDEDALFVDALLDDDDMAARPEQEDEDALSDDAVLDEEFEAEFEFPQEEEAALPAPDSSLEDDISFGEADDLEEDVSFGEADDLDEDASFGEADDLEEDASFGEADDLEEEAGIGEGEPPLQSGAAAESFGEADEERILKAGQLLVAQVSASMRGGIDLDSLLDFAVRSLMENTGAEGGIIFIVDDYEDVLNARALSGQFPPPYKLPDDLPHSQKMLEASLRHAQLSFEGNVFGEAVLSDEAIAIEDGAADGRVYKNGDEPFLSPGSYIIAPLSVNDRVVGVAGLARPPQREPFSQKDFKAAKALAGYIAAAVSNMHSFKAILERAELESGVEAAAKIQKTFLPKKLPDLPEAGFGFFFREAKGVCTDYCDVIFARRDRIALVVADVAGKGIISAMIMTSLRALLHLVTNTTKSAATILDWVNKSITDRNIDIDHYAALSYVSYSPETCELEYASAGHQSMLLWRAAEGRIETVRIEAEPLGVDRGTEYKERKLTAAPGDIIILYTDGLVETLNPEGVQYGIGGLSKAVADNSEAQAKDIAAAVKRDVNDFAGSVAPHDDQTLLVLKIKNL